MQQKFKQVGNFYFDEKSTLLGRGTFGRVFKGCDAENNDSPVAIKVIDSSTLMQYKDHVKLFLREINILNKLRGDHIVEFKKVLQTSSGNLYIITNFCNGGSLEEKIRQNGRLPEEVALEYLRQIADAFVSVEKLDLRNSRGDKMSMMHRDIKPANILFHDGSCRLADFGFAKLIEDNVSGDQQCHTKLGSPLYEPPEILSSEPYGFKCDIWSMGIVTYEMLFGVRPWSGGSEWSLYKNIKSKPLRFAENTFISEETKDLLSRMLAFEESYRIDWKGILAHPAVQNRHKKRAPKKPKIIEDEDGFEIILKQQQQQQPEANDQQNKAKVKKTTDNTEPARADDSTNATAPDDNTANSDEKRQTPGKNFNVRIVPNSQS